VWAAVGAPPAGVRLLVAGASGEGSNGRRRRSSAYLSGAGSLPTVGARQQSRNTAEGCRQKCSGEHAGILWRHPNPRPLRRRSTCRARLVLATTGHHTWPTLLQPLPPHGGHHDATPDSNSLGASRSSSSASTARARSSPATSARSS
jgi:hypothetical protein